MKNVLMTGLTFGVALSMAAPVVADTRETVDRIVANTESVRREAQDVSRLLRDKKIDMATISERVSVLETHAQALRESIPSASTADPSLSAAQTAALDRARDATNVLLALLTNKTAMLADTDKAAQQRGLLRSKADAIAQRAAIVERHITQLRG